MGFVTRERMGKNVIFSLSPLGRLVGKVCGDGV
jgi:hypothetical protein